MLLPLVAPHLTSPVPSGVYVEERTGKEGGGDIQAIMCQMKRERKTEAGKEFPSVFYSVKVMKGVLQAVPDLSPKLSKLLFKQLHSMCGNSGNAVNFTCHF